MARQGQGNHVSMESVLRSLGYSSDSETQKARQMRAQQWYRSTRVEDSSPLALLLDSLLERDPDLFWLRLVLGDMSLSEDQCPIRLPRLSELGETHGLSLKLQKQFDLDTMSVVTDRLDIFDSVQLIPEFQKQYSACKQENLRGRVLLTPQPQELEGLPKEERIPHIQTRPGGVPKAYLRRRSAYITKRFLGQIQSRPNSPVFVSQMYCDLQMDVNRWAAWDLAFFFIKACLNPSGPFHVPNPRSSSARYARARKRMRDDYSSVGTSSRESNAAFMENLKNEEFRKISFDLKLQKVLNDICHRVKKLCDKHNVAEAELENLFHHAAEDDEGGLDDVLYIEIYDNLGRRERHNRQLIFNIREVERVYNNMLDNLWFIGTFQFNRLPIGKVIHDINGRNELLQQDHDKLGESAMKAIEGIIRTPRTADSFTFVMPNIGMELLVLKEDGKIFQEQTEFHEQLQPIRLHLDRRSLNEEKAAVGRIGAGTWDVYGYWGNGSKFDGPCGCKLMLPTGVQQPIRTRHGISPLLAPIDTQSFGRQSTMVVAYETTYRAMNADSALRQGQIVMHDQIEKLSCPQEPSETKTSVMVNLVETLKTEVKRYFKACPYPSEFRIEDCSAVGVHCRAEELRGGIPVDNMSEALKGLVNDRLELLSRIDVATLLGYSYHEDYPTLAKGLLAWLTLLEEQVSNLSSWGKEISPMLIDSLVLCYGAIAETLVGHRPEDASKTPMTMYFLSRSGLAIRRSMEKNGFPTIPPQLLCGLVNLVRQQDGREWITQILSAEKHSYVAQHFLKNVLKKSGPWTWKDTQYCNKYQAQASHDVFAVSLPGQYPWLLGNYLGAAFLTRLVTEFSFGVKIRLYNGPGGPQTANRCEILEVRYMKEDNPTVWTEQDLNTENNGWGENAIANILANKRTMNDIIGRLRDEGIASPEKISFCDTDFPLEREDHFLKELTDQAFARIESRDSRDQTLYMHVVRGILAQVPKIVPYDARTDIRRCQQEILTDAFAWFLSVNQIQYWTTFSKEEEWNKFIKMIMVNHENCGRYLMDAPLKELRGYDKGWEESLFLQLSSNSRFDGRIEGHMRSIIDYIHDIGRSWQNRQLATHFIALSRKVNDVRKVELVQADPEPPDAVQDDPIDGILQGNNDFHF